MSGAAVWLADGATVSSSASLGVVSTEWSIAGTGDFNADDQTDLLLENTTTGERAIWLMNGTTFLASSTLGIFPLEWTVKN